MAASHNTDKWNVYWPSGSSGGGDSSSGGGSDSGSGSGNGNSNGGGGSGSLTEVRCSVSNPCGKCEGDCDNDRECKGNLQCKQRYGSSALSSVPGCSGQGVKGLDYCY